MLQAAESVKGIDNERAAISAYRAEIGKGKRKWAK
jgi:hypothetical protein